MATESNPLVDLRVTDSGIWWVGSRGGTCPRPRGADVVTVESTPPGWGSRCPPGPSAPHRTTARTLSQRNVGMLAALGVKEAQPSEPESSRAVDQLDLLG